MTLSTRSSRRSEFDTKTGIPEELDLQFQDVSVFVGAGKDTKCVLNNISGSAKPRGLLALMGATGSGKTTMLTVLANRLESGANIGRSSKIRYGGYKFSKALKRLVGFVEQDDVVIPNLTVRQSLTFTARLRLGKEATTAEQDQRVEETITQLRLNKCADTIIGSPMARGVSGGERKRVAIATEMLTKPRILFLDEPTSGLDSTTALSVTQYLKELSYKSGITVVCSIHQPSSQIYHSFENLCFLHEGNPVYFGPISEAVPHYAKLGFACPEHYNPPDYFMELAVEGKLVDSFVEHTRASQQILLNGELDNDKTIALPKSMRYTASYTTQLTTLMKRISISVVKDKINFQAFLLMVSLAVNSGFLWFDLSKGSSDVFPRTSLALWNVGTWMFFPVINSLGVFASDAVVLRKEMYVGAYRLSAYYITKSTTLLPIEMMFSVVFTAILYTMTLFRHGSFEQFILMQLVCWLTLCTFYSIGFALVNGIPGKHLQTCVMLAISFCFAYTGLFREFDIMYDWLSWLQHVNPLLYAYHLILYVMFEYGPDFDCVADDQQFTDECSDGKITPQEALDFFKVDKSPGLCVGVLVAIFFIMHLFSYQMLRRTNRRKNTYSSEAVETKYSSVSSKHGSIVEEDPVTNYNSEETTKENNDPTLPETVLDIMPTSPILDYKGTTTEV
eukprot:m.73843 g.73843  ORF g.73843 m.73843 type:complete len:675 (+) comp12436_c0_seq4:156-2180(+)